MDWLLPFFLISNVPRANRGALVEQILPVALPGPPAQRLALAAITAEQQLRRQAATNRQILEDAIKAGGMKVATDLAKFPALDAAFKGLPAADQAALFP